jgi:hypothetical protein
MLITLALKLADWISNVWALEAVLKDHPKSGQCQVQVVQLGSLQASFSCPSLTTSCRHIPHLCPIRICHAPNPLLAVLLRPRVVQIVVPDTPAS